MRVLLVEDSVVQADVARSKLEQRGVTVVCATTLLDALDVLQTPGTDVICSTFRCQIAVG